MSKTAASEKLTLRFWLGLLFVVAVISFFAAWMLVDIFEKKQEGKQTFFRVVELTDDTYDPEVWGKNFPQQYDDYLKTVDMECTRYGGSEAIPHVPTEQDPRNVTSRSMLEQIPDLKRMWAGYAFSKDYREKRGHAYMLTDQELTQRQVVAKQPGTCIHCHASTYVAYKELGDGDLVAGFEKINQMPYSEAKHHFDHPIACIDCHDSQTMQLRVTRPAFMEGIAAYKEFQGVKDFQVTRDATRQEMRSFVCAQCHVEYYFKGEEKRLVYPWKNGLKADEILAYFDEEKFTDWTHAETGAPMLKAQHPEFELWSQGIHSKAGVTCSDCHMPYKRVGAMKVSDHHVRSPLLNMNNACQVCHKVSETDLLSRVHSIQDNTMQTSKIALNALMDLIDGIVATEKDAEKNGVSKEQLDELKQFQRHASFLLDFVKSENSAGFHADQEAMRILAKSIEASRQGMKKLLEINQSGSGESQDPSKQASETESVKEEPAETDSTEAEAAKEEVAK